MDEKALKKRIIYLESRNNDNLPYSDEAKAKIKQSHKKTAKSLRIYLTKTKEDDRN